MNTIKFISIVYSILFLISCNTNEAKEQVKSEWRKYELAMQQNDYQVAKNAVYNIIAIDSNNHSYYDTLAKLYYLSKDFESAHKSSKKALQYNVSDLTLKIAYQSANTLKLFNDKKIYGEQLLITNKDSIQLEYDLALNDILLKDYQHAEKLLEAIITHPKSLTLNYNEYRGNGVQSVPYRAAAYNLFGFIYSETSDTEDAKKMFKAAIEIKTDYILAKENLLALENSLREVNN